jgi:predicted transcriptional regulator
MGGERVMNPDNAVAHETRKRLMLYIRENPGATFQRLKGVFKLNEGTLRYHLNYLIRTERIIQVMKNHKRTYLPAGMALHKDVRLNRDQKRLMDLIKEAPGITRKELLERSRQSRKLLSYNLSRLNDLGLVWKIKEGRRIGYALITRDELHREAFAVLVDKLLENEIDIDRFRELKHRLDLIMEED